MSNQYDVVVIGGGPIGLASAYRCAKAGKSVLLLERFNFFNPRPYKFMRQGRVINGRMRR